jgi:hypothetical protein
MGLVSRADRDLGMILLETPWQLATPIGDAECHVFDPGGPDAVSRFLCTINDSAEWWWFDQRDVRRNTNLTEGRTTMTPFSKEAMERFAPMRKAARALKTSEPA